MFFGLQFVLVKFQQYFETTETDELPSIVIEYFIFLLLSLNAFFIDAFEDDCFVAAQWDGVVYKI